MKHKQTDYERRNVLKWFNYNYGYVVRWTDQGAQFKGWYTHEIPMWLMKMSRSKFDRLPIATAAQILKNQCERDSIPQSQLEDVERLISQCEDWKKQNRKRISRAA